MRLYMYNLSEPCFIYPSIVCPIRSMPNCRAPPALDSTSSSSSPATVWPFAACVGPKWRKKWDSIDQFDVF